MRLPTITYKPGHIITLREEGDLVICEIVAEVVDCYPPHGPTTITFKFETAARGLDDDRVLKHWVSGCIARYETHESKHWLRFDGSLMSPTT